MTLFPPPLLTKPLHKKKTKKAMYNDKQEQDLKKGICKQKIFIISKQFATNLA